MNRHELYEGMRVCTKDTTTRFARVQGSIIEVASPRRGLDCLVEFDEHVDGHNGLGWGTIKGLDGHCYWFGAHELEEILDDKVVPDDVCSMSYGELFAN